MNNDIEAMRKAFREWILLTDTKTDVTDMLINGSYEDLLEMAWQAAKADSKKEIEQLKAENEYIKQLIDMSVCPNCDGSGAKYDNYGEVEQCQWCYEKNELTSTEDKQMNDREAFEKKFAYTEDIKSRLTTLSHGTCPVMSQKDQKQELVL